MRLRILLSVITVVLASTACRQAAIGGEAITIPAGIDHAAYGELLERHVDARGLVDYRAWNRNEDDRAALDGYLKQYEDLDGEAATGAERHAALVNLYNAVAIRMVLRLDPEESLWDHDPFKKRIHRVGGRKVSLDDIEHRALRPEFGYRTHAVVVCAAMSCPPLLRAAYRGETLERQANERFATWLAREDLNRFEPEQDEIHVSKIFDWFGDDFEQAGGLGTVLARHAPERYRDFLRGGDYTVHYRSYDKTLNAQRFAEEEKKETKRTAE